VQKVFHARDTFDLKALGCVYDDLPKPIDTSMNMTESPFFAAFERININKMLQVADHISG
jgi:hypothetical protein